MKHAIAPNPKLRPMRPAPYLKSLWATGLLAMALLPFAACSSSSAKETSKQFPVKNFTALELEVLGEVIYTQSDSSYMHVSGSANLIERLSVNNDNGTLKVELKDRKKFSMNKKELVIRLGSPQLTEVDFSSIGTFHLAKGFTGDALHIANNGVGQIKVEDCAVTTFALDSKGVGSVVVQGTATDASIRSEGMGEVDCAALKAANVKVESKGVGNISVYATTSLNIQMSGVGNLKYYGNPADVKTAISGMGKATNMGQ
ncbi:MAG: DUF2807 domain-containing protein [Bacteroidetes bacterium]|nr:DUF2807 domain-containing protein [Bacteroidota bacterium]